MKIQLHDFIGNHSGMYLYIESFRDLLVKNKIKTTIHSNYKSSKTKKTYPNIFKGGIFKKLYNLFITYIIFLINCLKLDKNEFIIVSIFGTKIDLIFLAFSCLFKSKIIIDVHEVVKIDDYNIITRKLFSFLYSNCNNKIISHSIKTDKSLISMGYNREIIKIPHVHYSFKKNYDILKVFDDVKLSVLDNQKHFLFFGNIVSYKGISDLLSAIEILAKKNNDLVIIIAGKDSSKIIHNYKNLHLIFRNVKLILRHINDDEMKYLFSNCDYVLLPYREIYQSGVLEMAVTFQKPMLTSDISYFKNILNNYPSFGKVVNTKNKHLFANEILQISNFEMKEKFYEKKELLNYFANDSFNDFIENLKKLS